MNPARMNREYCRRTFIESTDCTEKAAVGEVLPGTTWEMKDHYHLLKVVDCDLTVHARRVRERETFHVRGILQIARGKDLIVAGASPDHGRKHLRPY